MGHRPPTVWLASGGGNDFLALPEPSEDPTPQTVRAWCRRGVSLGADGLFVLRRSGDGRVSMAYSNADGRPAALCVNGTRCAARLAFELGWADASHRGGERVVVETCAGPLEASLAGRDRVRLEIPPPEAEPVPIALATEGRTWAGHRVTIGVPHLVLDWPPAGWSESAGEEGEERADPLASAPVARLGALLRRHPDLGPAGANVDFVRFPSPGRLDLRTFERGVEAETLACGTGVLAAVLVGLATGAARLPVDAFTLGGFELRVEGEAEPGVPPRRWWLTGDARLVARIEPLPGAEAAPAPSAWAERAADSTG